MADRAVSTQPGVEPGEQARIVRRLREHIAAGGSDDTNAQIEDALWRWPASHELHTLKLHWLKSTGQREALRTQARRSREQFPDSPQVALFAFRAAVEDNELSVAADLLCEVIWPARPKLSARGDCLEALLEGPVAEELVEATLLRLLDGEPDRASIFIQVAMLDLKSGRWSRALERLERAEALAPLPREAEAVRIEALLKANQSDDAFGLSLDRALHAMPHARRLYALKEDFHEKRGEREAARSILALARERFPDDSWFARRAFRVRLSDKDLDGAALLLDEEIWRSFLPESARRGALGALVREWKDPDTLQAVLEGLLHDTPDDRFVLVKLASLATRQRRHFDAVRYIEKAEHLGPLPAEAETLRVSLLVLGGDIKGSLVLAKQQLADHPDRKDLVRRANIVASINGSLDDINRTIRQALEQWPTDASILQRYNRVVIPEAEDRKLFEHVASFSRANSIDWRWRYQFALACLRRKETPRACAILRDLLGDEPIKAEAQRLLDVLDTRPLHEWDERARLSNDATKDVQVIKVPSAEATFVVMAGLHGGLRNLPFTHLDVLLQQHPVNVVYLRDNRWSAFTSGIPGLGPDEASTVSALAALCADLGPMPVITFGGSLAGWSAMRYGALMGAQAAVSLAGPTRHAAESDRPARFVQHYLARILPESARELPDLLGRSPALRVIHVYGGRNARDVASAARLRQLANVTLVPVEECDDHFVAAHLVASGSFHPLIKQAISMARMPASG